MCSPGRMLFAQAARSAAYGRRSTWSVNVLCEDERAEGRIDSPILVSGPERRSAEFISVKASISTQHCVPQLRRGSTHPGIQIPKTDHQNPQLCSFVRRFVLVSNSIIVITLSYPKRKKETKNSETEGPSSMIIPATASRFVSSTFPSR